MLNIFIPYNVRYQSTFKGIFKVKIELGFFALRLTQNYKQPLVLLSVDKLFKLLLANENSISSESLQSLFSKTTSRLKITIFSHSFVLKQPHFSIWITSKQLCLRSSPFTKLVHLFMHDFPTNNFVFREAKIFHL